MENEQIKFLRLDKELPLPKKEFPSDAGYDLRAAESKIIAPQERYLMSTGLKMAVPIGYEAQVRPRSGLAVKYGISVVNSPGTIDATYRGEVKVILINHGREPFSINKGDRIAQLVVQKIPQLDVVEVDDLEDTIRGEGGFGSTGRN